MERLLSWRTGYALLAALYVLTFPYHPGLRPPNELCRMWQSRAVVEDGTLNINGALRRYGYVGDLSVKDGLYYPSKAPLLSMLGVPVYWAIQKLGPPGPVPDVVQVFWSRLFLTILPTLLMLWPLRRFLSAYVAPFVADGLTVTYALGSMAFNYSQMFLSHQLTGVLVFGAFYAAWRTLRGDWRAWGWLVSGAFAGAVVACEYTGALEVLCLAVFALVALRQQHAAARPFALAALRAAGLVLLGGLPFLAGLMAYHQAAFGGPLTSGYKYLNDAAYQGWHLGGFLGIRYPDPSAFAASFFSPLRGLFMGSPFLLLALLGVRALWRREKALGALAVAVWLGNAYFTSSFDYSSWGWAIGPRHLTPMLPLLVLPAALWLDQRAAAGGVGHGLAVGLCAASVLVSGALTFINYMPDSASGALFGVALPLFSTGHLPPSVLAFFGLVNPTSGALLLALVGLAALWVSLKLSGPEPKVAWRRTAGATAAAVCVHLALLSIGTRRDEGDKGAENHLRQVWLTPPGVQPAWWPRPPR